MKQLTLCLIFVVLILTACGPSPEEIAAQTTTQTATLQPTTTQTNTPEPTATNAPITIILEPFQAEMIGLADHGNITCLKYSGDGELLFEISLEASFFQAEKLVEKQIPLETVQIDQYTNSLCFENMDAKYQPGIEVTMSLKTNTGTDIQIENDSQVLDLGIYIEKPFLYPFLPWDQAIEQNGAIHVVTRHRYEEGPAREWYAVDVCPGKCQPGTWDDWAFDVLEIRMPCSMKVLGIVGPSENGDAINIIFEHPYTGYRFIISHTYPTDQFLSEIGNPTLPQFIDTKGRLIKYDQDIIVSKLSDRGLVAHLHFAGQNPNLVPNLWEGIYDGYSESNDFRACPINGEHPFSCPDGGLNTVAFLLSPEANRKEPLYYIYDTSKLPGLFIVSDAVTSH